MTTGHIDLAELLRGMANREVARTEANVQSDLRTLLLAAPLELEEGDLVDIVLEQQAGGGRRIDVEAEAYASSRSSVTSARGTYVTKRRGS